MESTQIRRSVCRCTTRFKDINKIIYCMSGRWCLTAPTHLHAITWQQCVWSSPHHSLDRIYILELDPSSPCVDCKAIYTGVTHSWIEMHNVYRRANKVCPSRGFRGTEISSMIYRECSRFTNVLLVITRCISITRGGHTSFPYSYLNQNRLKTGSIPFVSATLACKRSGVWNMRLRETASLLTQCRVLVTERKLLRWTKVAYHVPTGGITIYSNMQLA